LSNFVKKTGQFLLQCQCLFFRRLLLCPYLSTNKSVEAEEELVMAVVAAVEAVGMAAEVVSRSVEDKPGPNVSVVDHMGGGGCGGYGGDGSCGG
jgi:hypothetical protein